MLLTNKEVVEILDDRLDYSDFGNWYGSEDDLIEFAYYLVKADIKVAKKVSNVAGKVAGKAVGAAKSKVKADIKAAKTVAGFAAKTAMSPVTGAKTVARFVAKQAMPPSSNPILKGAKAAGKAIAGDPLKNLIKAKKAKKK